jgi:hypothetical protein
MLFGLIGLAIGAGIYFGFVDPKTKIFKSYYTMSTLESPYSVQTIGGNSFSPGY